MGYISVPWLHTVDQHVFDVWSLPELLSAACLCLWLVIDVNLAILKVC